MRKISIVLILIMIYCVTSFCGCNNGNTFDSILIFPVTTTVESTQEIEITDVFCTYDEELSYFYFIFTLKNTTNRDIDINYCWTLNDPKDDFSLAETKTNNTSARVYQGDGEAFLSASSMNEIKLQVEKTREYEYDSRYYVMYIAVYCNDVLVGYYRDQKAPSHWDYSVTPPVETYTPIVQDYE